MKRVSSQKLLAIIVTDHLKWEQHVSCCICSKSSYRLNFPRIVKRSGASASYLLYYYETPSPFIGIRFRNRIRTPLHVKRLTIDKLSNRLIGNNFFHKISQPANCLNHLLPPELPVDNIGNLYTRDRLSSITCTTELFRWSSILYGLSIYHIIKFS